NSHVAIKAKEYLGPFTDSYIKPPLNTAHEIFNEGLSKGQDITGRATTAIWDVKNKFTKAAGGETTYTNGNISPAFNENALD
ncbi:6215_t:CDS:1, partial [Acaulospora morrowiae]